MSTLFAAAPGGGLPRELNRLRGEEVGRHARVESELARVRHRLGRIVDAIADGIPSRTLKDELLALEERREELERQIATAEEPPPLLHPSLPEVYRQKVAALHEALAVEGSRDQAFELIRSLVDKVVLTPVDGELRIDLYGELAGILSMCQDGKTPRRGSARALAEQIKLVAGACNHLYRTFVAWRHPHRRAFLAAERTCHT